MAEMNKANVHASERVSARDMIQTTFEGDEDLSLMTDKDVAKMKKKAEKDEKAARAALAAHQVCDSYVMTNISTNTASDAPALCCLFGSASKLTEHVSCSVAAIGDVDFRPCLDMYRLLV